MAEPLPSKQKMRVRFSLLAPTSPRSSSGRGHQSFKSDGAGSSPARGSTVLALSPSGQGTGAAGSDPCFRDHHFAGLAKWEGIRSRLAASWLGGWYTHCLTRVRLGFEAGP
jgi:hypothetical protein